MKIIVLISVLFLSFFSCDKPNEPKPEPEKDTKVYFFEQSGSQKLYIYSTLHNRLDSTVLPYTDVDFIEVSPDGELLYLVGTDITIVDTRTFSYVNKINIRNISRCIISPNNKFIALSGVGFYILSTSDLSLLYEDSITRTSEPHFTTNSQTVYCTASDTNVTNFRFVQKIDLTTTPYTKSNTIFENQYVYKIKTSDDESKWYLTTSISPFTSAFEVYDISTDSIIFTFATCPADINMVKSSDDNYVYFTNPGNFNCALDPNIQIYDVDNNSLDTKISSIIDSMYRENDTIYEVPIFDIGIIDKDLSILSGDDEAHLIEFYNFDIEDYKLNYSVKYWNEQYRLSKLTY